MLQSVTIKNFRGFRNLKLEPLARVNLITGENNVGKTGVLEALYLLFASPEQFRGFPSAFRSSQEKIPGHPDEREKKDNFASFWRWLPHLNESPGQIQIIANVKEPVGKDRGVNSFETKLDPDSSKQPVHNLVFHYSVNNGNVISRDTFSAAKELPKIWSSVKVCATHHSQPTDDAELFNSIVLKKKKQPLIEALKIIEPRLEDIQYLKVGSEPLVYTDLGLRELTPLTQLGQGFSRLFRFVSEMLVEEANIILIDEIENGIHHSAMTDVWRVIAATAAKEDLQIFATTHSWECIQAAQEAFSDKPSESFRLHRLEKISKEIKVVTYDQESIDAAMKFEMEVR